MDTISSKPDWTNGGAVRVPWGNTELDLQLPPGWPSFLAHATRQPPPAAAPAEMLEAALAQPRQMAPLREIARDLACPDGRPTRIAIVVDDNTRHTPVDAILPTVLDHLGVGRSIADSQIEIHFAGGTHQPMTPAQMADKIGAEPARRFACFNNPLNDPLQYRYLGVSRGGTPIHLSARVAEADLRVLIGSVSAHLQAGFAGGFKLLFPGLSSRATIKKLHLGGTARFRQLVGLPAGQNPMRQEIDALGGFLDGVTFAVQLLLDERHQPVAVSAGDPVAAQRALAEQAVGRFAVATPGPADLLVTNSAPLNYDLWQGFKCIANTLFAAREGGVVVAMLKADHGSNGMKLPSWHISQRLLKAILRFIGRDGLLSLLGRLVPQINDEAKFFARFCLGTLARNHVLLYAPTLVAEGIRFPGIELYDSLPAVWARAAALLGPRTPNVTVFGQGGVCYPLGNLPA